MFIEYVICCQMLEKFIGKVIRIRSKEEIGRKENWKEGKPSKNFLGVENNIIELNSLKIMNI